MFTSWIIFVFIFYPQLKVNLGWMDSFYLYPFVFFFMLIKFLLIRILAYLNKTTQTGVIHNYFFNTYFMLLTLLLLTIQIISEQYLLDLFNLQLGISITFFILWIITFFYSVYRIGEFYPYYIFSYICVIEVVPFLLLLGYLVSY